MSLSNLITHIIIEDTNRKEYATARANALFVKANMVQGKPAQRRYGHKTDHNKNKNKNIFHVLLSLGLIWFKEMT